MKPRWDIVLLILIMLGLFWVRLEFATSTPYLNYESYFTVRNVENIIDIGEPIREDFLSVTGSERSGSPVFGYILAAFIFITPMMYKILPNILMVLMLIPIFFMAKRITKSFWATIASVLLAGSAPIVFSSYLNTPSEVSLAGLVFLTILAMLHNPNRNLFWILGLTIFLTFMHPIAFLLVVSLLAIILLLRLEGFGVDKRINELFFFTLLLTVWFNVLLYKQALFSEGIRALWQNLPSEYLALQFGPVTWLGLLYALGVVTFLFGILGVYNVLFESRTKEAFAVIGASIAITGILLLKLIPLQVGLLLLSMLLSVIAGYGISVFLNYCAKTKVPWVVYPFSFIIILLFIFTAIFPALSDAKDSIDAPDSGDVAAFKEINLPKGAVVLASVKESSAVQYFGNVKTLTDEDFLLVDNGDELVKDIDDIYTARFSTTVVGKADKLGFTHILFSHNTAEHYDRKRIFVEDPLCLSYKMLPYKVRIYTVRCTGDV